jgi:ABC-type multidrug transport system fused ATPase/permease subunit
MTCTLIAASRMFKKLNSTIFYSNMKFFDSNPKGRIMNRISNDIFVVDGKNDIMYK